MVRAPPEVGRKARDEVLLREVIDFHLNAVAECTCCGHKKLLDDVLLEGLVRKHGRDLRMGDLAKILKWEVPALRGGDHLPHRRLLKRLVAEAAL